jgi:hypothetical protein
LFLSSYYWFQATYFGLRAILTGHASPASETHCTRVHESATATKVGGDERESESRKSRYGAEPDRAKGLRSIGCNDWHDFKAKLDKSYPRQEKPTQLSFDYAKEEEDDSAKGL